MIVQPSQQDVGFLESCVWTFNGIANGLSAINLAVCTVAIPVFGTSLAVGLANSRYASDKALVLPLFAASLGLAGCTAALVLANLRVAKKSFNNTNF